jgi:uncharacterized membrane protein YqjE
MMSRYNLSDNRGKTMTTLAPTTEIEKTTLPLFSLSDTPKTYRQVLRLGNITMLMGLLFTVITILICYVFDEYFPMAVQVLSHIVMLIAATAIKIGYIMRCIGRHGLGAKEL